MVDLDALLDSLQSKAEAAEKGEREVAADPNSIDWLLCIKDNEMGCLGKFWSFRQDEAELAAACDPDTLLALIGVVRAARVLAASYGIDPNQRTAFDTEAVIVERERFDALAAALENLSPSLTESLEGKTG